MGERAMGIADQKEERRRHAERIISQGRDRVIKPLETELAQIAEDMGRSGLSHSSAHVDRRLRLYLQKASQMAEVVVKAYVDASNSPDDFTVEEVVTVAAREIDAIRLRAFDDLANWAKRLGYSRPVDALSREIEGIKQGARRDIEVELGRWRMEQERTGGTGKRAPGGNEREAKRRSGRAGSIEGQSGQNAQGNDFSFVADKRIRKIVERDDRELGNLRDSPALKSRMILAGGLIEALLLDALQTNETAALRAKRAEKKPLLEWGLSSLIDVAVELRIITSAVEKLGDGVREFRNLVHPGRELVSGYEIEEEEAKIAESVLEIVIRELRRKT